MRPGVREDLVQTDEEPIPQMPKTAERAGRQRVALAPIAVTLFDIVSCSLQSRTSDLASRVAHGC